MEIDDINYDIDNVDIEEEMEAKDIEDEEAEEQERREAEEEKKQAAKYKKMRLLLSSENLDIDLKKTVESERTVYSFKKKDSNIIYKGYVVYKFDDDAYIFSIEDESGRKSKKFRLSEIKLIF